ncbi:2-dehydro-3-deoxygalactonokinase [Methylocapsa sp. S129]|uniref:2-dehydro-3-deoxygalactonokinase n=1 Tax=Methylocapsa sp. S129 TaxID=1641869 RepID=UPI00131CD021|nr:2-dehydro-3-deoxygalactonokinase [Methylocapsa sp. S129]
MTSSGPAAICIDWGTSSFRAYLVGVGGTIIERVESARGILTIAKGEHEDVLAHFIGGWLTSARALPILMSGMIGARQGWVEAPYAPCPAGLREIAASIVTVGARTFGAIGLVPGVSALDRNGAPDVMRGEETQILGALAALDRVDGTFVLPGTHSKWARVEAGRIVSFATYMTGEVFSALKDHTILGRLMEAGPGDEEGFAEGVRAASRLERPGDVLHAIFMTRTLGLFDRLGSGQLSDYLSGLLIGAELLSGARGAQGAIVIGSPALTARYCAAGAILGLALQPSPEDCAPLGQLALLAHWRPA